MTLEELLAQSVTDEAQRSQLLNAIKQDRAGLETNKQQILDELKEERKARQQQADKLKEFDGIDPAQVRAIMGRFENDEELTTHKIELVEGVQKYTIELPRVRYTQGQKQVSGPGAIIPSYTLSAGYDGAAGTTMKITRTAA